MCTRGCVQHLPSVAPWLDVAVQCCATRLQPKGNSSWELSQGTDGCSTSLSAPTRNPAPHSHFCPAHIVIADPLLSTHRPAPALLGADPPRPLFPPRPSATIPPPPPCSHSRAGRLLLLPISPALSPCCCDVLQPSARHPLAHIAAFWPLPTGLQAQAGDACAAAGATTRSWGPHAPRAARNGHRLGRPTLPCPRQRVRLLLQLQPPHPPRPTSISLCPPRTR